MIPVYTMLRWYGDTLVSCNHQPVTAVTPRERYTSQHGRTINNSFGDREGGKRRDKNDQHLIQKFSHKLASRERGEEVDPFCHAGHHARMNSVLISGYILV